MNKEQFLSDLQDLCEKHGVTVFGSCESEGIAGEILIKEDKGDVIEWRHTEDGPARFKNNGYCEYIEGRVRAKKFDSCFKELP